MFWYLLVSALGDAAVTADTIGARRSALSFWLLPAQTTSPARPVDDGGSCKNRSCGVYSCRLDCCKSLLYGLPDTLLRNLQSVQNATARLITGTRRSDHISPVLRKLYWLPIRERV